MKSHNSLKDKIKKIEELNTSEESLVKLLEFIGDNHHEVKVTAIQALSAFYKNVRAKHELIKLAKDSNSEIRYYAFESLTTFFGDDVVEIMVYGLNDSDKLIRILSAEALGCSGAKQAIPDLIQVLGDKSELVRGTAAETLGRIGSRDLIPLLEERLKNESRNAARLRFYIGLYYLGEKHYLDNILKMLKAKSYKVRCAVANSLPDLIDQVNSTRIIGELKKAQSKEKTAAVKSSISNALSEIYKAFG